MPRFLTVPIAAAALAAVTASAPFNLANAQTKAQESDPNVLAVRYQLADKTFMTFSPGHGTQVSYLRGDGTELLWYPGNKVVLKAKWRIEGSSHGPASICFQYGTNTYNPMTREIGGSWECRLITNFLGLKVDSADGDVFGLGNRENVPMILAPDRTTIVKLKQRVLRR